MNDISTTSFAPWINWLKFIEGCYEDIPSLHSTGIINTKMPTLVEWKAKQNKHRKTSKCKAAGEKF